MAVVFNADGLVLGRLSSHIAKRLRQGEEIVVINADKAVVSGRRAQLLEFYKHRMTRGESQSKAKGPNYPRTSDQILKRTVRGMVEYKKPSGRAALKRLTVYIGVPKEYKASKYETFEEARKSHLEKYLLLGDISKEMGSKRELKL
ncbi:MAG: 50S ribosomal protein L13 [Thermoplasmata archaeon]|jgi:large subunit ribosomal protein L13|nr:50S ribosomal protein L13 [Thermoplasmata archaeon]